MSSPSEEPEFSIEWLRDAFRRSICLQGAIVEATSARRMVTELGHPNYINELFTGLTTVDKLNTTFALPAAVRSGTPSTTHLCQRLTLNVQPLAKFAARHYVRVNGDYPNGFGDWSPSSPAEAVEGAHMNRPFVPCFTQMAAPRVVFVFIGDTEPANEIASTAESYFGPVKAPPALTPGDPPAAALLERPPAVVYFVITTPNSDGSAARALKTKLPISPVRRVLELNLTGDPSVDRPRVMNIRQSVVRDFMVSVTSTRLDAARLTVAAARRGLAGRMRSMFRGWSEQPVSMVAGSVLASQATEWLPNEDLRGMTPQPLATVNATCAEYAELEIAHLLFCVGAFEAAYEAAKTASRIAVPLFAAGALELAAICAVMVGQPTWPDKMASKFTSAIENISLAPRTRDVTPLVTSIIRSRMLATCAACQAAAGKLRAAARRWSEAAALTSESPFTACSLDASARCLIRTPPSGTYTRMAAMMRFEAIRHYACAGRADRAGALALAVDRSVPVEWPDVSTMAVWARLSYGDAGAPPEETAALIARLLNQAPFCPGEHHGEHLPIAALAARQLGPEAGAQFQTLRLVGARLVSAPAGTSPAPRVLGMRTASFASPEEVYVATARTTYDLDTKGEFDTRHWTSRLGLDAPLSETAHPFTGTAVTAAAAHAAAGVLCSGRAASDNVADVKTLAAAADAAATAAAAALAPITRAEVTGAPPPLPPSVPEALHTLGAGGVMIVLAELVNPLSVSLQVENLRAHADVADLVVTSNPLSLVVEPRSRVLVVLPIPVPTMSSTTAVMTPQRISWTIAVPVTAGVRTAVAALMPAPRAPTDDPLSPQTTATPATPARTRRHRAFSFGTDSPDGSVELVPLAGSAVLAPALDAVRASRPVHVRAAVAPPMLRILRTMPAAAATLTLNTTETVAAGTLVDGAINVSALQRGAHAVVITCSHAAGLAFTGSAPPVLVSPLTMARVNNQNLPMQLAESVYVTIVDTGAAKLPFTMCTPAPPGGADRADVAVTFAVAVLPLAGTEPRHYLACLHSTINVYSGLASTTEQIAPAPASAPAPHIAHALIAVTNNVVPGATAGTIRAVTALPLPHATARALRAAQLAAAAAVAAAAARGGASASFAAAARQLIDRSVTGGPWAANPGEMAEMLGPNEAPHSAVAESLVAAPLAALPGSLAPAAAQEVQPGTTVGVRVGLGIGQPDVITSDLPTNINASLNALITASFVTTDTQFMDTIFALPPSVRALCLDGGAVARAVARAIAVRDATSVNDIADDTSAAVFVDMRDPTARARLARIAATQEFVRQARESHAARNMSVSLLWNGHNDTVGFGPAHITPAVQPFIGLEEKPFHVMAFTPPPLPPTQPPRPTQDGGRLRLRVPPPLLVRVSPPQPQSSIVHVQLVSLCGRPLRALVTPTVIPTDVALPLTPPPIFVGQTVTRIELPPFGSGTVSFVAASPAQGSFDVAALEIAVVGPEWATNRERQVGVVDLRYVKVRNKPVFMTTEN